MDVLYLTDSHLSDSTLDIHESILSQLLEVHKSRGDGDTAIIHGGDIFNSRKAQSYPVLTTFNKVWYLFHSIKKSFFLAGNHDKTDTASDNSWLDLFITRGYGIYKFNKDSELQYTFLDYYDREVYKTKLVGLKKKLGKDIGKTVLFTHIGVEGVESHHSIEATKSDFEGFYKVISGHYHNHSDTGNIYYAGSAYQANFGEDDNKGFLSITEKKGELIIERIPTKYKKYITHTTKEFNVEEFCKEYDLLDKPIASSFRVITETHPSEEALIFLKENNIRLQYKEEQTALEEEEVYDHSASTYTERLKSYLAEETAESDSNDKYNQGLLKDFSLKVEACVGE